MSPSSTPPAASIPGLDVAAAMARLDLSYDEFKELLAVFPQAMRDASTQLQAAVAAGGADSIRFAAHAMAGLAGNYGADSLWHAAKEMEEAARAGRVEEACAMSPQIVVLAQTVSTGVENALE